ncbi:hypothetical protein [Cryobacterium arcticum]|uniref:Uncharacterized protein n=1 Tax=Cryobacterium arcticum TaxID=670052 RepID=A0A317ZY18_9MICO|nr:hypothetical protein [Cryobacterium arcticum]PXA72164.1 hypothetical protein CTB96_04505 [Cryobacterium arcticum]
MTPLDERPQVGTISVDPGCLEQRGEDLDVLLADLAVQDAERPPGTPSVGWRVLDTHDGHSTTIGAPVDDDGQWWRVGQIQRGSGEPVAATVWLHPSSQRRRPSRRDRAAGLVMRWPEVTRSAPDLDLLAIDIVNAGTARWHPQGDSFMVFAELRRPGGPAAGVYFGYVSGQSPAMPLDPGEYARVRVVIDAGQWDAALPGPIEVHAILLDLGLHADDPLTVTVTEQAIQDHLPKRRPPAPPAPPAP